jgi:hypothetical protein
MTTETNVIASENCHWYDRAGTPVYEVFRAKGDGMRPTTITDARKLDLLPSVTNILNVAAKPGLQKWKLQQMLHAALTLPRIKGETDDAFAERVIADSEEQSRKSAEKGTQLHAAIESELKHGETDSAWQDHVDEVFKTCSQYGIDLLGGNVEHSFASPLGYGGKIDFHTDDPLILDFKTKSKIENGKQLAWPEHIMQLAAYGFGTFNKPYVPGEPGFRALNVFIGVADRQVRVVEYSWEDIYEAFQQFLCLLQFWQRTKNFGPYAKNGAKP